MALSFKVKAQVPNTSLYSLSEFDSTNLHQLDLSIDYFGFSKNNEYSNEIIESDKTKTLASPGITDSVKSALDSALSRNGASISNLATKRFELDIHKLQAVVTEKMMTHTSDATIELGLRVIRNSSTFSKIYRGNANLEGPLSHDRAKVEGQLNKLTEQIITRIVSDPELIAYLEG